jgi:two-component system, LytTR family, response regulator LytT
MEAPNNNQQEKRIKVLGPNGMERYPYISDIVYLKGDDNYTLIHLNEGSKFLVRKTLSIFEAEFGFLFIRCHKSYLVNSMYISGLDRKSSELILNSGKKIPFPRNKAKMVREIIQNAKSTKTKSMLITSEEKLFNQNLRIIK